MINPEDTTITKNMYIQPSVTVTEMQMVQTNTLRKRSNTPSVLTI